MSRRLLVFIGNKLAKVGSGDVELLRLLAGVYYALGVDYTLVLIGVLCVVICVAVPGVEGIAH
jgi:hypothetical protein